jgi:hypothetical protein
MSEPHFIISNIRSSLQDLVQMFEVFRRCGKEDGGFALSLYVDPILLLNYDGNSSFPPFFP